MTKATLLPRNAFLGFDHIFDQLENIHSHAKDTYPPHNVVKHDAYHYEIELAVAGFSKEHIDIEIKDHVLTIKGDRPQRRPQRRPSRRHRRPRHGFRRGHPRSNRAWRFRAGCPPTRCRSRCPPAAGICSRRRP